MKKAYVYANSQPLIQYDGSPKDPSADIYFYLHDRLGSVRQVIDADGNVVNSYTYNPFGEDFAAEVSEEIDNSFKFTGQFYDEEINQYYLRARQYDPQLMRFTAIDPVTGKFKQPMTLHRYLYCLNNPINMTDPDGEMAIAAVAGALTIKALLPAAAKATVVGLGVVAGYMNRDDILEGAIRLNEYITNSSIVRSFRSLIDAGTIAFGKRNNDLPGDFDFNDEDSIERLIYEHLEGMNGNPEYRNNGGGDDDGFFKRILVAILQYFAPPPGT